MPLPRCELFGCLYYDSRLTYEELMERESFLQNKMLLALEECGGSSVEFTPHGDELLFQALFQEVNRDQYRAFCDSVTRHLGKDVLARFFFVDKYLEDAVFYFLGHGKWKEQALSIPGPVEALSGWVVRRERPGKTPGSRTVAPE